MDDKITLLIRNGYRPELFERCISSINNQTYGNINLIIGCDSDEAFIHADTLRYRFQTTVISLRQQTQFPAYWNLYCNELKSLVRSGWFMFLDNDDYLASAEVIEKLMSGLEGFEGGVITQFIRNGKAKPHDRLMDQRQIQKGRIGGGSLVLHAKFKDIGSWDGYPAADFRYITDVAKVVPMKFLKLVVQIADQKNFGR